MVSVENRMIWAETVIGMNTYVVTGSSGWRGRAIHRLLSQKNKVIGYDLSPGTATSHIGDLADYDKLRHLIEGCDGVFHAAALHAPHVGIRSDYEFEKNNVEGTANVLRATKELGVENFVFTSTTALYGHASKSADRACWITEETTPIPRTIYHRSKIAAETIAQEYASKTLKVTSIRMSRCFPEPVDLMAMYRLHRGIDARDVARAHLASLNSNESNYSVYIVSGKHPFEEEDCEELKVDAAAVIRRRAPALAEAFNGRGWMLPNSIDRVYDSSKAMSKFDWQSQYGFEEVLAQHDRMSPEVLPRA